MLFLSFLPQAGHSPCGTSLDPNVVAVLDNLREIARAIVNSLAKDREITVSPCRVRSAIRERSFLEFLIPRTKGERERKRERGGGNPANQHHKSGISSYRDLRDEHTNGRYSIRDCDLAFVSWLVFARLRSNARFSCQHLVNADALTPVYLKYHTSQRSISAMVTRFQVPRHSQLRQ